MGRERKSHSSARRNRLPRELAGSPFLETLKPTWMRSCCRALLQGVYRGPFQPLRSCASFTDRILSISHKTELFQPGTLQRKQIFPWVNKSCSHVAPPGAEFSPNASAAQKIKVGWIWVTGKSRIPGPAAGHSQLQPCAVLHSPAARHSCCWEIPVINK